MLAYIRSHFNRNQPEMNSKIPESRSGHVAAIWNDIMYIWGGYNNFHHEEQELDPKIVWKYDTIKHIWFRHAVTGYFPSSRLGSCASQIGSHLYVFGGLGRYRDMNDINVLHLNTLTWEEILPIGVPPSERNKSACCTYKNRIIFFGGYGPRPTEQQIENGKFEYDSSIWTSHGRGWNSDLFAYDRCKNEWISLPSDGDVPSTRAAHAFASNGNKAYLYGGRHLGERLDDFYQLCLETYVWTFINCKSVTQPIGRSWHSLTPVCSDKLFLFGGMDTKREVLSDGWIYSITNNSWTLVRDGENPRLWHSSCSGSFTGQVLVFAGCESNIFLEDLKHSQSLIIFNLLPKPLLRICLETLSLHRKSWMSQRDRFPPYLYRLLCRISGDGG